MEDILGIEIPEGRIFNASAVLLATFFGGPLAGAWVIGHNYKVFGDKRKMLITWLAAGLLLIATVIASVFVAALEKVPNIAFVFVFMMLAQLVVKQDQKTQIDRHINHGGLQYKKWVPAAVGIGIALIMVALFLLIAYVLPAMISMSV